MNKILNCLLIVPATDYDFRREIKQADLGTLITAFNECNGKVRRNSIATEIKSRIKNGI